MNSYIKIMLYLGTYRGLLDKFQLCDSKVVALNPFASFFVWVIASHIVIALPTIATAIVVALLRS